jgi:phosphohistidine swiveling domain-containing protein
VVSALLADMMRVSFRTLGFSKQPRREPVAEFLNQPYLSIDYIEEVLGEIGRRDRQRLVARFSNIFDQEEEAQRLSLAQLKIALHLIRFTRRLKYEVPSLLAGYHQKIERIKALNVKEMSDAELLASVRRISFSGAGPLLNNDFLLIAAIGLHRRLLETVLRPAFGDRSADLVNNLLSGVCGNVIMDTNNLVWELAQTARAKAEVLHTIQAASPSEALRELNKLPQAEPFLAQLAGVLEVCGHREQHFDICYPTWGEDPAPVLAFVRSYLDVVTSAAPAQREAGLTAQRQALTREVEAALGASASGRLLLLPLFRYLLPQTQWLVRERDTMHYEWTRLFPPVRRMQLEVGRRWQKLNLIDQPEDIFFLTLSEQESMARLSRPCLKLISERKAAYQANVAGPWPEVIIDGFALDAGQEAPPAAAPRHADDRESPDALAGVGGSPGYASGPARIILGPHDFHRLRQGEILVAPVTNPSWTPLFAIAGGIITEVGGVLSHGAIVAREYGIPAVLSAQGITGVLADGETVAVDGDRGLIMRQPSHSRAAHNVAGNHTIITN